MQHDMCMHNNWPPLGELMMCWGDDVEGGGNRRPDTGGGGACACMFTSVGVSLKSPIPH